MPRGGESVKPRRGTWFRVYDPAMCPNGHPRTPENTVVTKDRRRRCKLCRRRPTEAIQPALSQGCSLGEGVGE